MNSKTAGKWIGCSERYIPVLIWGLFAAALSMLLLAVTGVGGTQLESTFYKEVVWAAIFPSTYMLIAFMRYRYLILATAFILPASLPALGL